MSKITGSFLILVFVIIFSSIAYIWKAESERKNLETTVKSQQEQITSLKSELKQKVTALPTQNKGMIAGETTETGTLLGTLTVTDQNKAEALIVCTKETRTKQETCVDILTLPQQTEYDFSFEIPQGVYEIYALTPPAETKVYYSEISTCTDNTDCTSNMEKRRLIKVEPEETQSDINISL